MQSDPDAGEAMPGSDLLDDPQRQADRVGHRIATDHHRVTERLYLLSSVPSQQRACRLEEAGDDVGVLIAVDLGQGGEAREVREQEGVVGLGQGPSLASPL